MELSGPRWGNDGAGAGEGADAPKWPTAVGVPSRLSEVGPGQGANGAGERAPWALDGHGAQPPTYWWPDDDGRPQVGSGLAVPAGPGQPKVAAGPGRAGGSQKPPGLLRRAWQRVGATLAAVAAFLAKFGALLLKLKYVGLVLSMFVSIVAYSLLFGWSFAVGIVLLIFVHEMGHVIELRRQGVPASAPLFIPFLGAFVNMKAAPRSAFQEAMSGLAGPLVGTAASAVVAFWGNATGSRFLMALAFFGFFVNLFNLLPVLPLDGGRAVAALHPVLWLVGLVCLVGFEVLFPSPVVLIVLVLGGFELWHRWRNRNSPSSRAYHSLLPVQRWTVATIYVLLMGAAIVGAQLTYVARSL
ncbi:MAG: site-2 protease family protein [Acidimicrobiales bacterium]